MFFHRTPHPRSSFTRLSILAGASSLAIATFSAAQEAAATARAAVERALPFIEREGVAWIKEKACVSCHHVPFLLWSFNEARARGVRVDEKKLGEWTDWSWTFSRNRRGWYKLTADALAGVSEASAQSKLKPLVGKPFVTEDDFRAEVARFLTKDELKRHGDSLVKKATRPHGVDNDGGGLDTVCQLILGRSRDGKQPTSAPVADLQELVLRWQQSDGSWRAAGQLPAQNRPAAETHAVTTMWAVLTLKSVGSTPRSEAALKRAADATKPMQPGVSNESLIGAMLVDRALGRSESASIRLEELLARQNPDGGWAWRRGAPSDAFGTGQALYALGTAGLRVNDPGVERGRRYLIQSQSVDGSWAVPGGAVSSATAEVRLTKLAPIYRFWGSAWATIGLLQTLPESTPARRPDGAGRQ